jgi:hypothetical protein
VAVFGLSLIIFPSCLVFVWEGITRLGVYVLRHAWRASAASCSGACVARSQLVGFARAMLGFGCWKFCLFLFWGIVFTRVFWPLEIGLYCDLLVCECVCKCISK